VKLSFILNRLLACTILYDFQTTVLVILVLYP